MRWLRYLIVSASAALVGWYMIQIPGILMPTRAAYDHASEDYLASLANIDYELVEVRYDGVGLIQRLARWYEFHSRPCRLCPARTFLFAFDFRGRKIHGGIVITPNGNLYQVNGEAALEVYDDYPIYWSAERHAEVE